MTRDSPPGTSWPALAWSPGGGSIVYAVNRTGNGDLFDLFAIVMAYPYLPGSGSDAFKGMSVLIGLMVTVGGSSVIGQALSGMILMFTHTIRVGEYVRISDHEGTVVAIGTFTTRMNASSSAGLAIRRR